MLWRCHRFNRGMWAGMLVFESKTVFFLFYREKQCRHLLKSAGMERGCELPSACVGSCGLACTLLTLIEIKLLTGFKRQAVHSHNLDNDCFYVPVRVWTLRCAFFLSSTWCYEVWKTEAVKKCSVVKKRRYGNKNSRQELQNGSCNGFLKWQSYKKQKQTGNQKTLWIQLH